MGKNLLIINPSWEQDDLVSKSFQKKYNIFAIFFDKDSDYEKYFIKNIVLGFRDYGRALNFAVLNKIDFIISSQCDYSLLMQAYLSEKMNLPSVGLREAQISCNKYLQRTICKNLSYINQPKFELCFDFYSAKKTVSSFSKETVFKPIDNRGSIGVSINIGPKFVRHNSMLAYENSLSGMFLVEERKKGTFYIVEGLGCKSLIVGEKKMDHKLKYLNTDILFVNRWYSKKTKMVSDFHERICKDLKFKFGQTSGEYIFDKYGKIWLVEITNRGGGVWIGSKIIQALTSLNTSEILLTQFDQPLQLDKQQENYKFAYLKYIIPPKKKINEISGFENWARESGYLCHKIWQKLPAKIKTVKNAIERSGVLIIVGNKKAQVINKSKDMINSLKYQ